MADLFQITPPTIRAEGKDVPPEQIQAGFNSLARQTQNALNTVGSDPTGPAGGDLSGNYPNPTVAAVHATSGTLDGVVIGGTTPAAATVTTLTASTAIAVTSGGTGRNALNANNVIIGEGSSAVNFAAPGTSGQILASNGAAADPSFQTKTALTIASSGANTDITSLNAPALGAATATTAAAHTNTTQVATTAFVETEFASPPTAGVGSVTPSPGTFTTLTATTPVGVASGGTGRATLTAHAVLVGETTAAINQVGPGTTGQMLLGVTGADPVFGNNPTITGGTIDNVAIGGTTASSGKFTTITASSTITPSSTAGIVGTTTNDNANAGSVGELLTATTTATSASSGVLLNATSLSLTAGDWEVSGLVQTNPTGSTTQSSVAVGLNTTSATFGTITGGFTNAQIISGLTIAGGSQINLSAPIMRLSLSATTTVFLVANIGFAVSTLTVNGFIHARRVR